MPYLPEQVLWVHCFIIFLPVFLFFPENASGRNQDHMVCNYSLIKMIFCIGDATVKIRVNSQ